MAAPRLPCVGKPTSKSSQTVTMITGSNAFGVALPPHFQFMTHAETDQGKQVKVNTAVFCLEILGQWGGEEEVCAPVTFVFFGTMTTCYFELADLDQFFE